MREIDRVGAIDNRTATNQASLASRQTNIMHTQSKMSQATTIRRAKQESLYVVFLTNVLRVLSEKGMSKRELSRKSGVSVSFLTQLTKGRANPSLRVMEAIAHTLETPLSTLLESTDLPPEYARIFQQPSCRHGTPSGFERVTVTLPVIKAYIVKQWAKRSSKAIRSAALILTTAFLGACDPEMISIDPEDVQLETECRVICSMYADCQTEFFDDIECTQKCTGQNTRESLFECRRCAEENYCYEPQPFACDEECVNAISL